MADVDFGLVLVLFVSGLAVGFAFGRVSSVPIANVRSEKEFIWDTASYVCKKTNELKRVSE